MPENAQVIADCPSGTISNVSGTPSPVVPAPALNAVTAAGGADVPEREAVNAAGCALANGPDWTSAAALLGQKWPAPRDRYRAAQALAGLLLRAGVGQAEVVALLAGVASRAGDGNQAAKFERLVRNTARKLDTGKKVCGAPTLAKLLGDDGDDLLAEVSELLRLDPPEAFANGTGPGAALDLAAFSLARLMQEPPKGKLTLATGLLHTRDIVCLAGRRRHGKTGLVMNLALAGAFGRPQFINYTIPAPFTALYFFLEDDREELREKFHKMLGDAPPPEGFSLITKDYFFDRKITIDAADQKFRDEVLRLCRAMNPELVVLDNVSHLVGGKYNDGEKIHQVVGLAFALRELNGAAVILCAHVRKRSGNAKMPTPKLAEDAEGFFEETMGASHLINSCGSLWGIEREREKERRSVFVGGTQRLDGTESATTLEMDDAGWFHVLDDYEANYHLAMNTDQRKQAWDLLPQAPRTFQFEEGRKAVQPAIKSRSSFNAWLQHLVRLKMVIPGEGGRYTKAAGTGKVPN